MMKLTTIRYWLIWLGVIVLLVASPRVLCSPLKATWYQRKGLCLCMTGFLPTVYTEERAQKAVPLLEKSLEFYFPSWESHFLLGLAYSELKDYSAAEKEYLFCLRFNPGYAKAHYNLGNACYHLNKYEEAIHHYLSCLKIDPTFSPAQKNLAAAQEMRRRTLN